MKDIHDLRIFSKTIGTGMFKLKVKGDAYSFVKKFEQKKLSGSPFVVYDVDDILWAFDVNAIDYIIIDNAGYNSEPIDSEE